MGEACHAGAGPDSLRDGNARLELDYRDGGLNRLDVDWRCILSVGALTIEPDGFTAACRSAGGHFDAFV
jgi:hypothetical protein